MFRPRPPRSCRICAGRKVRCDKVRPVCSRCAVSGITCSYADHPEDLPIQLRFIDESASLAADYGRSNASSFGRGAVPTSNRQSQSMPDLHDNLDTSNVDSDTYLESDFTSFNAVASGQLTTGQSAGSPLRRRFSSPLIRRPYPGLLLQDSPMNQQYIPPAHFLTTDIEHASRPNGLRSRSHFVRDPVYTRNETGSQPSSVARPSSDARESEQDSEGNIDGDSKLLGDIFSSLPDPVSHPSAPSSLRGHDALEAIVAEIPSRQVCDMLIQAYMTGYHTLKPVFHGPSFLDKVDKFFRWTYRPRWSDRTVQFLSLLIAVLYAGSVICPQSRIREVSPTTNRGDLSKSLYHCAVRAIRATKFPNTLSTEGLAAFIVTNSTCLREEQPLTCCAFVGLAVRAAQMLGLHRDPAEFSDMTPIEIEVRRRLWWTLVTVDAQVAFASGLPPLIICELYDVKAVSEAAEKHFGTAWSGTKSIPGVLVGGIFSFYRQASRFLHLLHNSLLSKKDIDEILVVTRSIRENQESRQSVILELENMSVTESASQSDGTSKSWTPERSDPIVSRLSCVVLKMLASKPYAIMYGPLARNDLLTYLRSIEPDAVDHCRDYLRNFLLLTQDRAFKAWHWSWPGNHQPLHSVLALIMHLDEFPDDAQADVTRQLIDLAVYLCGASVDSGIKSNDDGVPDERALHHGGLAIWDFILQARQRVWKHSGLDPTVLRCPEDVREIAFPGAAQSISTIPVSGIADMTDLPRTYATGFDGRLDGAWPDLSSHQWF